MFSYLIINKSYITTYLFWRSYAAHYLFSNCIYVIAEQLFNAMCNQAAVLEQKSKEHLMNFNKCRSMGYSSCIIYNIFDNELNKETKLNVLK